MWTVKRNCDNFIQSPMVQIWDRGGAMALRNNERDTYACFVMDLYVIQWRWVCCGMLLLLMANFNVGLLMHLSLVIPHIIQSHIWKKGGEGWNEGRNVGNSSIMALQSTWRWGRRGLGGKGAFHGWLQLFKVKALEVKVLASHDAESLQEIARQIRATPGRRKGRRRKGSMKSSTFPDQGKKPEQSTPKEEVGSLEAQENNTWEGLLIPHCKIIPHVKRFWGSEASRLQGVVV